MKRILCAAFALTMMASPVLADGMDNALGHTVTVTTPDGSWDTTFHDDGTFDDTRGVTGTWTFDGELCITAPNGEGEQSQCGPWNESANAGDSWATHGWSSDGSTEITIAIN
jgi:hypothetical protein